MSRIPTPSAPVARVGRAADRLTDLEVDRVARAVQTALLGDAQLDFQKILRRVIQQLPPRVVSAVTIADASITGTKVAERTLGGSKLILDAIDVEELAASVNERLPASGQWTVGAEAADVRNIRLDVQDIDGASTVRRVLPFWMADTAWGAAALPGSFVSIGATIGEIVRDHGSGAYTVVTDASGTFAADVELSGADTTHFHAGGDAFATTSGAVSWS